MAKTDDAIRQYLNAIQNPDALVDDDKVSKLSEQVENEEDPIKRLKLRTELDKASNVSPEDYEEGFINNAKSWAESNSITADAFIAEGVPESVLARAGMISQKRTGTATKTRTRVSADDVRETVLATADEFSTSDIAERSGASDATARKVVQELVDSGEVEEVGPDPDHTGRGRAATLYKVK